MKRQGQLIEKIADIENLQLAYHKAQKGKAGKIEVFEYGKRLQENLQNLQLIAFTEYANAKEFRKKIIAKF